jgi:GNAT superfamily N-acetyltransferase
MADESIARETHVEHYLSACAFVTPRTPQGMFNRVLCMSDSDVPHLPAMLRFFEAHGAAPRFDVCPLNCSTATLRALASLGFIESRGAHHCRRLMALPDVVNEGASSIEVTPLTRDTMADWLLIDEAVWPSHPKSRRAKLEATWDAPRFHRFLAWVNGQPAALGRLEIEAGIASLNGAGTLPAFRGLGCHRALIAARAKVARELGCDAITSLVTPGSASENNLRAYGFVAGADRQIWVL